jgi:hypothetical protein
MSNDDQKIDTNQRERTKCGRCKVGYPRDQFYSKHNGDAYKNCKRCTDVRRKKHVGSPENPCSVQVNPTNRTSKQIVLEPVCLIASHVTETRIQYIQELVSNSITNQIHPCRVLWGWSAETSELKIKMDDILQSIPHITSYHSEKKRSQFQHYKHLSTNLPNDCTFVFFSDDDDLWTVWRTQCINNAINQCKSIKRKKFVAFRFPTYIRMNDKEYDINELKSNVESVGEHWQYVVKREAFCEFINVAPDFVLAHKYCDMRFMWWVRRYGGATYFTPHLQPSIQSESYSAENAPMYVYRIRDESVCGTAMATPHSWAQELQSRIDKNPRLRKAVGVINKILKCDDNYTIQSLCNNLDVNVFATWFQDSDKMCSLVLFDKLFTYTVEPKKIASLKKNIQKVDKFVYRWAKEKYPKVQWYTNADKMQ